MKIVVLEEHGHESALLGLSLSHRQAPERMAAVARRLAFLGDGHNKFLEAIAVWLDIVAPRYFWQQFDTYRVGVSRQSESTMHTLTKRPLAQADFAHPVPEAHLEHLNQLIAEGRWEETKWLLPESFLQRRVVSSNYMALQRIVRQRATHRLPEWHEFIDLVLAAVEHPEYLKECESE